MQDLRTKFFRQKIKFYSIFKNKFWVDYYYDFILFDNIFEQGPLKKRGKLVIPFLKNFF